MDMIALPEKHIPVLADVDLCVLGGSCTGVFAAVRAARLGLKVALCEKQNSFGGVATQGLVTIWHSLMNIRESKQIIAGLTQEMLDRMEKRSSWFGQKDRQVSFTLNTEELKIDLDELVLSEKNIAPFLHTPYADVLTKENGDADAVLVWTKSGLRAIRARMFVDATGDGDLLRDLHCTHRLPDVKQPPSPGAKFLGMEPIAASELHELMHAHGAEFGLEADWGWSSKVPGAPGVTFHVDSHVFGVNCADVVSLTKAEFEGRRQVRAMQDLVRAYRPDLSVALIDLCSYIGIRETRHFDCLTCLTEEMLLGAARFPDAIANGTYPVDVHHDEKPGITFKFLTGLQQYVRDGYPPEDSCWLAPGQEAPDFYQIPYSAMVPRGVSNVIAAGRMIDADKNAYGAIRVMVNTNQTGEAAGVAAYCALLHGTGYAGVDGAELRARLKAGGSAIV